MRIDICKYPGAVGAVWSMAEWPTSKLSTVDWVHLSRKPGISKTARQHRARSMIPSPSIAAAYLKAVSACRGRHRNRAGNASVANRGPRQRNHRSCTLFTLREDPAGLSPARSKKYVVNPDYLTLGEVAHIYRPVGLKRHRRSTSCAA